METTDKNSAAMSTHHEQAKKLRKLRTRQRVVSLIGIAILVCGLFRLLSCFWIIKIQNPVMMLK